MTNASLTYASQTTPRKQQLTDVEVAEYLAVSVSTVRRWRLTGSGPRWVRICGSVRYPIADLQAYLASLPSGGGHQAEAH
jgi:predicted DNA-binding transcriptional regulator AlpA